MTRSGAVNRGNTTNQVLLLVVGMLLVLYAISPKGGGDQGWFGASDQRVDERLAVPAARAAIARARDRPESEGEEGTSEGAPARKPRSSERTALLPPPPPVADAPLTDLPPNYVLDDSQREQCKQLYPLHAELMKFVRGSWKEVDLEPFDEVRNKLASQFVAQEGDTSSPGLQSTSAGRKAIATAAQMTNVNTICQVGFGDGQVTAALLKAAKTQAQLIIFDEPSAAKRVTAGIDALRSVFNAERLKSVAAHTSLPVNLSVLKLAASSNSVNPCDLIVLHGAHLGAHRAIRDLKNLANAAFHLVLVVGAGDKKDVDAIIDEQLRASALRFVTMLRDPGAPSGVLVGQYRLDPTPFCPERNPRRIDGRNDLRAVMAGNWKSIDVAELATSNATAPADHYMLPLVTQKQVYAALARMKFVSTICEVASNSGMSAALLLKANPGARVILFDADRESAASATKYLSDEYESRVQVVNGGGPDAIETYATENPSTKCDLLGVMGAKSVDEAVALVRALRSMSNPVFAVGAVDNTNCREGPLCVEPAMAELARRKMIKIAVNVAEKENHFGLTAFQFVSSTPFCKPLQVTDDVADELRSIQKGSWKNVDLGPYDALLHKLARATSANDMEGHSGQLVIERKLYVKLAQMSNVKTICEIGFNNGHSASLWLKANPKARVIFFDMWGRRVSEQGYEYLTSAAAAQDGLEDVKSRLSVHKGDSWIAVPKFIAENPDVKCDLVSVDGAHSFEMAVADMTFMKNLVDPNFHIGVIDDTSCESGWCVDSAVTEMQHRGQLRTLFHFSEHNFGRGVTAFQYRFEDVPTCPLNNGATTEARQRLHQILGGAWKSTDLSEFNKLATELQENCGKSGCTGEGNSGELVAERKLYVALAQMPNVKRICEIGFNKGHSASLWLKANPTAKVVMFDLWEHTSAQVGEAFLLREDIGSAHGLGNVRDRLTIVKGNSIHTVRSFAADHPETKCDLLSVDGSHDLETAARDMYYLKVLANPDFSLLLVDDTNCAQGYCVDKALEEQQSRETLSVLLGVAEGTAGGLPQFDRGVTLAKYTIDQPMP